MIDVGKWDEIADERSAEEAEKSARLQAAREACAAPIEATLAYLRREGPEIARVLSAAKRPRVSLKSGLLVGWKGWRLHVDPGDSDTSGHAWSLGPNGEWLDNGALLRLVPSDSELLRYWTGSAFIEVARVNLSSSYGLWMNHHFEPRVGHRALPLETALQQAVRRAL